MTNAGASTRIVQSIGTNTCCLYVIVQQSFAHRATVARRQRRRMSLARICEQLGYEHNHVLNTECSSSVDGPSSRHTHTNTKLLASPD